MVTMAIWRLVSVVRPHGVQWPDLTSWWCISIMEHQRYKIIASMDTLW